MKLSLPQRVIADSKSRFKVVIAGRRWGKTTLSVREICYHARIPEQEIFYITSSYRAAKMIVWKPLKKRLLELQWVKKINESELSIQLVNGSTISLKGAENGDSLRGVRLDFVVFDEVASVEESVWIEVIRPALADRQGKALFIGTPQGKSNWSYDLWQLGQDGVDQWSSWQYTTKQGGWVTDAELEAARRDMTEKQYRQEFEATFESFEGRVAWSYTKDNIAEAPDTVIDIIHIGMDFNVNPMVCSVAVQRQNKMYVIDEIHLANSNTEEMCQEILTRYPKSKVFVYPDPAGSARKSSAGGMTDHNILSNKGFVVKAPNKHDPVRDRVNAINARFCSADGVRHLFISNSAKYTKESLDKHVFKPGSQIPDKDTGYDHMFDALSYMVAYLWPLRRDVPNIEPQRWTHRLA
jgi:hypothetical protein